MSLLFSSLKLGACQLSNRIIIAPMCQYSAHNGQATHWHTAHWSQLLHSGAGALILEATAVSPQGRISHLDLGLWDDDCQQALAQSLSIARAHSDMPILIQLAHAGRKASAYTPWQKQGARAADDLHGWQVESCSAQAYNEDFQTPTELTQQQITLLIDQFVMAAKRSQALGLNGIELHAAHGYLIHQFLSPLSNSRTDQYGGSFTNRCRFLIEIFTAIRAAVGEKFTLGIRVSATDWVDGGWDLVQTEQLAVNLAQLGCDFIHVSTGGLSPAQHIPAAPGFQVPFAQAIKAKVAMPVIAVGLITEPQQAEDIINAQQADAIGLARAIIYQPRWPWHAAKQLGAKIAIPNQYLRCVPNEIKQQ